MALTGIRDLESGIRIIGRPEGPRDGLIPGLFPIPDP
jgi:hypothetical protein